MAETLRQQVQKIKVKQFVNEKSKQLLVEVLKESEVLSFEELSIKEEVIEADYQDIDSYSDYETIAENVLPGNLINETELMPEERTSRDTKDLVLSNLIDFTCTKCRRTSKNPDYFLDKTDLQCPECQATMKFQCPRCKLLFRKFDSACRHAKQMCQINDDSSAYQQSQEPQTRIRNCTYCEFASSNVQELRRHVRVEHTSRDKRNASHHCLRCGKNYKTRDGMLKHARLCGREPHIACKFCSHRTKRWEHLRVHMKHKHPDPESCHGSTYDCPYCSKQYKYLTSMKSHARHCKVSASTTENEDSRGDRQSTSIGTEKLRIKTASELNKTHDEEIYSDFEIKNESIKDEPNIQCKEEPIEILDLEKIIKESDAEQFKTENTQNESDKNYSSIDVPSNQSAIIDIIQKKEDSDSKFFKADEQAIASISSTNVKEEEEEEEIIFDTSDDTSDYDVVYDLETHKISTNRKHVDVVQSGRKSLPSSSTAQPQLDKQQAVSHSPKDDSSIVQKKESAQIGHDNAGVKGIECPSKRKMPFVHGARKKRNLNIDVANKRSIVAINSDDYLCLPRALVVGEAYIALKAHSSNKTRKEWNVIRDARRKLQRVKAENLVRDAKVNVAKHKGVLKEIEKFQNYYLKHGIAIVIFDKSNIGTGETSFFNGFKNLRAANVKLRGTIFLLYDADFHHFDTILNLTGTVGSRFFCAHCNKRYHFVDLHSCEEICSCCFASPPCKLVETVKCESCNRSFSSASCFDNHKKLTSDKKCSKNSVCDYLKMCLNCCKLVHKHREAKHECGAAYRRKVSQA